MCVDKDDKQYVLDFIPYLPGKLMNVVSLRWKVKREHVWLVFARGKMIFLHNMCIMLIHKEFASEIFEIYRIFFYITGSKKILRIKIIIEYSKMIYKN